MDPTEPTSSPTRRRLSQMMRMTTPRRCVDTQAVPEECAGRDRFFTDSAKPENSEDIPYPLTREEAITFVKTKLHIPDPEAMMACDKLGCLNRVTERMNKDIPFTNMHCFMKVKLWEVDEYVLKRHVISGEGGHCHWVNPFTKALLERLGYKGYHICGYNPGQVMYDSHLGTIVEDAAYPGSLHLIDPGTRRPLNAAIPLDFEKESPEYKFHFMRSKFFRRGEKIIWCARTADMTYEGKYIIYDSSGQPWKQQVIYLLNERRNWLPYLHIIKNIFRYTEKIQTPPFNGLVFFAYLNEEQIISVTAFEDSIVAYLIDKDDSYHQLDMTKQDLLKFLKERFPQYSDEKLREVFEICPFY